MEAIFGQRKNDTTVTVAGDMDKYRESVRKLIDAEVKGALEQEVKKAVQELREEQKKAIAQILDEHKTAIRQIVEEEKKAIWKKADTLRESILKVGL